MPSLYYVEIIHIVQALIRILTSYLCIVQESESESISGSVIKPQF